jgi:thiol:disulfide interchange protein DsbC|tara:strand:+ start:10773 stop:11558 length:786 start_codon:yes stop_codon:yes gene_type:complete
MKLFFPTGVLSLAVQVGIYMKYRALFVAAFAFLSVSLSVSAASGSSQNLDSVKQKIQMSLGMQVTSIGDAPVPGLLQVQTDKGLFYTSEDGKYFLQARIFNLDEGMRNETETTLTKMRVDGVEHFKNSVIEYKADKEKYVVNVFTDITCGYCRKLHNQMDEYNDLGITVRYLAFPRAGLNSKPYQDMVSVWCSANPQKALNEAKGGENVAKASCSNQVAEQYNFGQSVGVNGTPNIILPNGSVVPGYQPPMQLLQAIQDAS